MAIFLISLISAASIIFKIFLLISELATDYGNVLICNSLKVVLLESLSTIFFTEFFN